MKIVFFVHSIMSDWNNGHAHFIRGLVSALQRQGCEVLCCEPRHNWSSENLHRDHGGLPVVEFARQFPNIQIATYDPDHAIIEQVDTLTQGADLVIVHEFNEPELVGAAGFVRKNRKDFKLLFHDTHHRALSVTHEIARFNLAYYDGVLAFGQALAEVYRARFGMARVWTLHEAADVTVFFPRTAEQTLDVVWIGNWGDEERTAEIHSYLIESARLLPDLQFAVYGVRYPKSALAALREAGIHYGGWLANFQVPEIFAKARLTLHLPRRFYVEALPGIPTIRPFEALACGIPLVSTPWPDVEGLFRQDQDYLTVASPTAMRHAISRLIREPETGACLAENGLARIRARHTCDHRAQELLAIHASL